MLLVSIPINPIPISISIIAANFPIKVSGDMSPYPTVVEVTIGHQTAVENETLSEMQYSDEVIKTTTMLV